MKLGVTKLSTAVRLALSLGAVIAVGASGTAFAQDTGNQDATTQPSAKKAQTLQTVVVTGSLIRRVDLETSNPVVTIDRAAIEATGKLTLGDLVQQLPVMTGGNTNPQINNGGGGGSSTLSLRGLGPNRTLILLDGHRIENTDPNSIPANMIERIEVLTTGASATYGSDAIGGVVNFITRKDYQGAQFTANYGESDRHDGLQQGYSFTFGQSSDKGNIMGGVEYNQMDGILASARPFSKNSLTLQGDSTTPTSVHIGGSASGQFGRIRLPKSVASSLGYACTTLARNYTAPGTNAATDYHCFDSQPDDRYNYAAINQILTPTERVNAFVSGTYNFGEHVQGYMDAYFNKTNASSQLAPPLYNTSSGANISAQSYYNPFGDQVLGAGNGVEFGGAGLGAFNSRLVGVGPRHTTNATTSGQVDIGIKGDFDVFSQNWTWDAGLNYGHVSTASTLYNLPNQDALNAGAGPSFLDPVTGLVTCGTPGNAIDNCIPFDAFNLQSPGSVAAQRASAAPALETGYSQERTYHVNLSGGVFDLPAGTVQLAAGASYRKLNLGGVIDPVLQIDFNGNCSLGTQCAGATTGGYNVKEAYAEVFVPVLKDLPFIRSLNVTIGDRYSRYSTFGNTNNFKFGLEWKPIDDLLLRGTMAQVFRAPNIGELFGGAASNADKLSSDPCNGYTGTPVNPACLGVKTDGSFINQDVATNLQTTVTSSGADFAHFPIKPEQGKTFDLGAVYNPSWLPGASASVDFWHVQLGSTISTLGIQNSLNLCYAGNLTYCPLITRFQSGASQGELSPQSLEPTGNLGATSTSGVDFSLFYKLPEFTFGKFSVGVNGTYLKYYNQQTAPGLPSNTTFYDAGHFLPLGSAPVGSCPGGQVCLFPRVRANGFANWQLGGWDASWRVRYFSRFQNGSALASNDTFPIAPGYYSGVILKYGATVYNDVQVGYNIEPINTRVDFGVNNLFDKQPAMLYANNTLNGNTDPGNFDLIGRYFWGRVTVKF